MSDTKPSTPVETTSAVKNIPNTPPTAAPVAATATGEQPPIPLQPIDSSLIKAWGQKANQLDVQFHSGDVYRYGNVTPEKFAEIRDAKTPDSPGKAFTREIKKNPGLYPFRKL